MTRFSKYYILMAIQVLFSIAIFKPSSLLAEDGHSGYSKQDEQQLKTYVEKLISNGYSLFNNKELEQAARLQQTSELLRANLHLDWMAKYSLGRHRHSLSPRKIKEFISVYSDFVIKAYVDLAKHYSGQQAKLKKVKQLDHDMFLVSLHIVGPGGNVPIKVDYLVHRLEKLPGKPFKVGDIITEGVSILNAQQAEFNSVIKNYGIDKLIEDLREKVKNSAS